MVGMSPRLFAASVVLSFASMMTLSACPEVASFEVELSGPDCTAVSSGWGGVALRDGRPVDILFVIDNSGSMAEHQVKLNAGIDGLFERLDAAEVDYRIAFTTSDSGNPWCPAGTTTPEGGNFVLRSCQDRLDDFLFNNGTVDARDLACNDQCSLDAAALAITPTATSVDPNPLARPWMERTSGVTNLPAGTDMAAAFKCFAPQGINGCGFESQLESMYLSLARAQDEDEDEYGFVRDNAMLAIVLVSDEADCSYDKAWAEIFEQDGGKVFWEDPSASFPSSAVCWNAGVSCIGDPSGYQSCEPVDKAASGAATSIPGDAVMRPLSRYLDRLEGVQQDKQELDPDLPMLFTLIAGVEGGGEGWSVSYADAVDPEVQLAFGIGPGCTGADGLSAVPPVRMRALAEATDPLGLFSTCASDFGDAMASLGDRIAAQQGPACHWQCVADQDLSTPQLEPDCSVEFRSPGADALRLVDCARGPEGAYLVDGETGDYQVPDGQDLCVAMRVDPDGSQTLDAHDDLSPECVDVGSNLEFVLERRPGYLEPPGTRISASCESSGCPEQQCPGMG